MTTRYRSLPLKVYCGLVHASVCTTFAQMLPCVSMAPLGVPVVPPVYLQHGEIVGLDRDPRNVTSGHRPQEIGERNSSGHRRRCGLGRGVFGERRDDDVADSCLRRNTVHQRRQRIERDDGAHARIGGDDQRLSRRIARVDIYHDRAQPKHRERGDDVLRTVRQHDADAVALHNTQARQRRGERVRTLLEVEIRQLRAEKLRGRLVGPLDGGDGQHVVQRAPGESQAVSHPIVPVFLPGFRSVRRIQAGVFAHAIVRPPSTTMVWPVM